MADFIKGTSIIGTRPALNAEKALSEIIGDKAYGESNYNESSMALTNTKAFTSAVISAMYETPVSQDGLGVFSDASVPNNSYLEHVSSEYGRAGMANSIERGMTMAKASLVAGSSNKNVIIIPIKDAYTVTQAEAVTKGGAILGNVELTYSGFSSTALTANLAGSSNPTIAIGTNPKVYVQEYKMASDPTQVVHVVFLGTIAIAEMFKTHFKDLTKNVPSANYSAFDATLQTLRSPLTLALEAILGADNYRIIYVQNPNKQWGDSPAGGPLLNWMSGQVYSTQTEVAYLTRSASMASSFPVINTKSKKVKAASWLLYPVVQALVYEGIFNTSSDWIERFFSNQANHAGVGKTMYDTYQMASRFGSNRTQKSCLSELAKGIADSIKTDFTRTTAAPSSARGKVVNYLNSNGVTTKIGIRI